MKSNLIVLGMTLALAVAGFFAGPEISRPHQSSVAAPAPTGDSDRDMANSVKYMNQAAGEMAESQRHAMVGAGAGAGCGLLVGIAIAALSSKKQTERV